MFPTAKEFEDNIFENLKDGSVDEFGNYKFKDGKFKYGTIEVTETEVKMYVHKYFKEVIEPNLNN